MLNLYDFATFEDLLHEAGVDPEELMEEDDRG